MNLITAEQVVRRIQFYFDGGSLRFLTKKQAVQVRPHLCRKLKPAV